MPKQIQLGLAAEDLQAQSLSITTIVRLRWIGIIGQIVAIGVVSQVLKFDLALGFCLAAVAMSAWLNVYLSVVYPPTRRLGNRFATLTLIYDIFQLMILLYLTGGIQNPFTMLIVVPVTVSAASLPLRNTILLGVLALVATAALVFYHQPLPWFDGIHIDLPFLYRIGMFFAVSASMVFLALYAWRLANDSRRMFAAKATAELVLAREQKLHALDGLAAAAAHELGTPLSTIFLVTKELSNDKTLAPDHQEDVNLLRQQAERCQDILRKLTRKPGEQDPMHASLSVRELLDEAATPYISQGKKITLDAKPISAKAGGVLHREPVGVRQPGVIYGLGNLIENAVSFAKSEVEITARWDDQQVTVEIADDGPGFSQDVMDSLGNPYVSSRPAGSRKPADKSGGLGLGFFIAKTLLERSGACFEFANRPRPQSGAIVRVKWLDNAFTNHGDSPDSHVQSG